MDERRVPTAESEAHRLVKNSFRRMYNGPSVAHVYNTGTH